MPSASQKEILDAIVAPFLSQPCADCGLTYPPAVMEFDHTGDNKARNVMSMAGYTKERILAEIAKCEVVCGNCHNLRTHGRRYHSI